MPQHLGREFGARFPAMAEEAGWDDDEDDNEQMMGRIKRHSNALREALKE